MGLKVFENPEFGAVRAVEMEGEPWFVGRDVAEALGYSNTKDALSTHVDCEDKRILQRSEITTIENHIPKSALPVNFVHADIPNRGLTIINESGLYSLVLSSKLPGAKKFKRWVTAEVLPSIRRHGIYATDQVLEEIISDPDTGIRLLQQLKEERRKVRELETKAEEDRPKVLFADSVSASDTTILVGDLAKLLRQNGFAIGQNRLFELLRKEGFLIKDGSRKNMPTQRAMEMGLFRVKERAISNPDGTVRTTLTTLVTGKGQQFFVNRYLG